MVKEICGHKKIWMKKIYIILSFMQSICIAQVQQDSTKNMGEVIVTGQYKAQSVKNSVYQVKVIAKDQIQKQGASKLQDVLNNQLNIRFSQDLSTGGSDINMLGLSGQNVKILIDGVPMTGRQGTSNEININQIEVNSIERIEIVEGPMSVIYGADALAGVINIITQKTKAEKLAINARLHEETAGREYGFDKGIHNQYIGVSGSLKKWYASGGMGRNLFHGWKDTATGRELVWHKKDQITGHALVGYRNTRFQLYYRLDGLDEIITNPSNISGNQPATDQEYLTQRLMQQLQGSYHFNNKIALNTVVSHTHFTRQVYSTLYYPNGDVRVSTAPGTHSLATFNGFVFRSSLLYKLSPVISFQPGFDINAERAEGERIKAGVQKINDYAVFVTAEITPHAKINIRPGIRWIKNSVYNAPPLIPSINAKFEINRKMLLRLAYARGFRSPSVRELYYDFFDASHSIEGNPDLKAEQSNSFTGSLTWNTIEKKSVQAITTLSGFYNDVNNLIDYAAKANNAAITTYININKYKTRGVTLSHNLKCKQLSASLGFTYVGRYNEYSKADKTLPVFKWSGEINSNISYAFKPIGLDVNLYYKYTGKLPYYQESTINNNTVIRLAETAGYHWADFTINKKLLHFFTLNAGIRNLFNVTRITNGIDNGGVHTAGNTRPIANGRSFFTALVFNWNKK